MEDGMYKISILKKTMILLALRKSRDAKGGTAFTEVIRGLKKSLKRSPEQNHLVGEAAPEGPRKLA